MYTTLGAPSGACGGANGAQSSTESRMSTLTLPLNGTLTAPPSDRYRTSVVHLWCGPYGPAGSSWSSDKRAGSGPASSPAGEILARSARLDHTDRLIRGTPPIGAPIASHDLINILPN